MHRNAPPSRSLPPFPRRIAPREPSRPFPLAPPRGGYFPPSFAPLPRPTAVPRSPAVVLTVNGPRFARALRAGTWAVLREQETLNRINVFPVADADTGANLAATLRAATAALLPARTLTIGQSVRAAADAALDGARGNSGAIFAQFLHGLAESVGTRVQLSLKEFVAAARRGADSAREALANPVEGTILSVLKAWAQALEDHVRSARDFPDLLARALERARQALAETPRQLQVLATHRVVDAGAQGFVYFLEGISAMFSDRRAASLRRSGVSADAEGMPFAAAHSTASPTFRYCSEALLEGKHLDRKQLAAVLAPFGDSLVVAGGGSRLRIHIHTNEPYRLFATLAEHASIARTKIDDMVLQQLAVRRARVALVTDSSCDLPETTCHALQLVRVPLSLSFGEEVFLDGVDITPAQFYRRLATSPHPPRTSQPAVGEFRRVYRTLLETHEAILSIHLSSGLSGTYQAALAASREVDPQRIRVLDSKQLSITLGLVVEAAGEARLAGGTLAEVATAAERAAAATKLYSTFPSLDTAVRGGRVPPSMARVARLFRLVPILSVDARGVAEKAGVAFGFSAALRRLASQASRWARGGRAKVLVAHANAIGAAELLTSHLMRRLKVEDIAIVNLAPVLAAHTGPGAVGVAVRRLGSSPGA